MNGLSRYIRRLFGNQTRSYYRTLVMHVSTQKKVCLFFFKLKQTSKFLRHTAEIFLFQMHFIFFLVCVHSLRNLALPSPTSLKSKLCLRSKYLPLIYAHYLYRFELITELSVVNFETAVPVFFRILWQFCFT